MDSLFGLQSGGCKFAYLSFWWLMLFRLYKGKSPFYKGWGMQLANTLELRQLTTYQCTYLLHSCYAPFYAKRKDFLMMSPKYSLENHFLLYNVL